MKTYLTLDLYEYFGDELEDGSDGVGGGSGDDEVSWENAESRPFRSIKVSLDKGCMLIRSEGEAPRDQYEIEYPEQLTNEFLIQIELMGLKKWDPMRYSPAFAGDYVCSWELDYYGLKSGEIVRSGHGTYPKEWPLLMGLIDAYNDAPDPGQDGTVHLAAEYIADRRAGAAGTPAELSPGRAGVRALDMVYILSVMRLPQDVIAAGMIRADARERGFDEEEVSSEFGDFVAGLVAEFNDWDLPEKDRRIVLIDSVRSSGDINFKKLVLAEIMSMLIGIKTKIDMGEGFTDSAMTFDEMGLFYAEIISALGELEKDERAAFMYRVLADMYKTVFVTYSLDSVRGRIYQMQGTTAGVMLRRGEYDWRPVTGDIPESADLVSKDLAMYLADQWRRQADEAIVQGRNAGSAADVPDLKMLKVLMARSHGPGARRDNKTALAVLQRMIDEGEQVLAAMHAGDKELRLISRGDIDDVASIAVSFLGLEDDEGNKMAAVFTSMEETGELDEDDIEAVPLKTLLRFVKHMDRLDGIIIDPFSDRFLVTKERIAEMLDGTAEEPAGM